MPLFCYFSTTFSALFRHFLPLFCHFSAIFLSFSANFSWFLANFRPILVIFGQLCTISTTSTTFSTTTKQTEYQIFNSKSGGSGGNSHKKNFGRLVCAIVFFVVGAITVYAIWDGQSRMIPCQGGCGLKQSQSGNTHRRCTGHPALAGLYAGSSSVKRRRAPSEPCRGESSHPLLL